MNKEFNIRLLYLRFKDTPYYGFSLISVVFLISFILFFQVVIPQVESWFSIRDEILKTSDRIATINQNITFMKNIDKPVLEDQVTVATNALPFEKNLGGILNALNDASSIAGVSLNDYSFQVGSVASVSGQTGSLTKDLSSVRIIVTVTGNVDGINSFLTEINKRIPLSEVIAVEGDSFSTTITIQFYQKQFPKIVFQDDKPFTPISNKESQLLQDFATWQPAVSDLGGSQEGASGSGVPLF